MADPASLPSADRPSDPAQRSPYWAAAERWTGPVAILAAGAAMLWRTWGTWPDPLIDFGRELYVPWQLTAGKVLYRDIAHLNGPLSPYLNALWFKLFGLGLRSLVFVNLAIWALLLWMLYRILVEIGGRFSATVACLAFVVVFSFAQYDQGYGNYNFICPYSHEITHGLALSVAAMLCVRQYTKRRRLTYAAAAGLLLGLVFLTKAEVFLACAAGTLTGLALALWTERAGGGRIAWFAAFFSGGALAPLAVTWALFCRAMPAQEALFATLGSCRYVFNRDLLELLLYRYGMGVDYPARSIFFMVIATGLYGLFLLLTAAVAWRLGRHPKWIRRAFAVGLFIAVVGVIGANWPPVEFLPTARPLPLFMLALGAALTVRFVRRRPAQHQAGPAILRITMVVFALALLLKMVLNARVYDYGFALAMPATLLLAVALIDWAPAYLTRRGGYGPLFTSAALAGVVVAVWAHLRVTQANLNSELTPVASGVDSFLTSGRGRAVNKALEQWEIPRRSAPPGRGRAVNWALEQVDQRIAADQTLVVVPEGVMINYLSRRRNPTPYINFMPPEIMLFNERAILTAMRSTPPDYVLVVHKDTAEYGFRFFGQDYGQEIFAWIESNYRPVSSTGAPPLRDSRFGMVMMRRIDRN